MAYNHKKHFVDSNHLLQETEYDGDSTHTCDICLLELAGLSGYCCEDCGIRIHRACADHFEKSIEFFADPHRLKLIRTPGGDRVTHVCDLCREDWPPASFIYRCDACDFDLHPLCSLLPETVDSPLHPGHVLRMITSPSRSCSACHESLPLWHYVCSCSVNLKLHIACAIVDDDEPAGGGPGIIQGNYGAADQRGCHGPAEHQAGSYGGVNQRGFGAAAAGQGVSYIDPTMIRGYHPFMQGSIPNINIPGYSSAFPGMYGPGIPGYGPPPPIPGFGPHIPGMYGPAIPGYGPPPPIPGYGPHIPGMYGPAIPGYGPPPPIPGFDPHIPGVQGGYGPGIPAQNNVAKPSRVSAIAKFLLKQSVGVAVQVATGGLLGSIYMNN
jgi:hypothetical protein